MPTIPSFDLLKQTIQSNNKIPKADRNLILSTFDRVKTILDDPSNASIVDLKHLLIQALSNSYEGEFSHSAYSGFYAPLIDPIITALPKIVERIWSSKQRLPKIDVPRYVCGKPIRDQYISTLEHFLVERHYRAYQKMFAQGIVPLEQWPNLTPAVMAHASIPRPALARPFLDLYLLIANAYTGLKGSTSPANLSVNQIAKLTALKPEWHQLALDAIEQAMKFIQSPGAIPCKSLLVELNKKNTDISIQNLLSPFLEPSKADDYMAVVRKVSASKHTKTHQLTPAFSIAFNAIEHNDPASLQAILPALLEAYPPLKNSRFYTASDMGSVSKTKKDAPFNGRGLLEHALKKHAYQSAQVLLTSGVETLFEIPLIKEGKIVRSQHSRAYNPFELFTAGLLAEQKKNQGGLPPSQALFQQFYQQVVKELRKLHGKSEAEATVIAELALESTGARLTNPRSKVEFEALILNHALLKKNSSKETTMTHQPPPIARQQRL